MSFPTGPDIVRLLVRYRQDGLEPLSPKEAATAARLSAAIRERFGAETTPAYREAMDDFERRPARRQASFGRLLDDLMRHDPVFAARLDYILASAGDQHAGLHIHAPPLSPTAVQRVGTLVISPSLDAGGPAPLPPVLADLCGRLMAAFNLEEMKDLALNLGFVPDTIPSTTLQAHARGLILVCWRAAKLDLLAAEAARMRPQADWTFSFTGLPATPPPEFDNDDMPFVRQTILAETVKNIRSIFSDWRQVALVLAVALGVVAIVYGASWYNRLPERMDGDFNVAVAQIKLAANEDNAFYGPVINQQVTSILANELDSIDQNVQVSNYNMGFINTLEDAERLARRANAHVVVYGEAEVFDKTLRFTPSFYVSDRAHAAMFEVNGSDFLEQAVIMPTDALEKQPPDTTQIAARAALLTDFTRALVYLAFEDLGAASTEIESAVDRVEADEWLAGLSGYEVIYLYASHIARLDGRGEQAEDYAKETVARNKDYARGYIAQANLYYDRGIYGGARDAYLQALAAPSRPGDLIDAKASLGLGNLALQSLAHIADRACDGEERARAEEALSRYRDVIDAYEAAKKPGDLLSGLAGQAHANTGRVHHTCGRLEEAAAAYRLALSFPLPAPVADQTKDDLRMLESEGG